MVICDNFMMTDGCLLIYLHLVWDFLSTTIRRGIFANLVYVGHEEHILVYLSLVKFSSLSPLLQIWKTICVEDKASEDHRQFVVFCLYP